MVDEKVIPLTVPLQVTLGCAFLDRSKGVGLWLVLGIGYNSDLRNNFHILMLAEWFYAYHGHEENLVIHTPKKENKGGKLGENLHILTGVSDTRTLFRYAAAKKKNCDLDGGWQNTSIFQQPFCLIDFGLLRDSPREVWARKREFCEEAESNFYFSLVFK